MTITFSFKLTAPLTQNDHYIVTNKESSRGVSISKTSLNILGSDGKLELLYNYRDWNTVFIQYSLVTKCGEDQCIFQLNTRRGFFKLGDFKGYKHELFIGGHPQKRNFANVILGNFEIYSGIFDEIDPPHYLVPDGLITELQDDMDRRIYLNNNDTTMISL